MIQAYFQQEVIAVYIFSVYQGIVILLGKQPYQGLMF